MRSRPPPPSPMPPPSPYDGGFQGYGLPGSPGDGPCCYEWVGLFVMLGLLLGPLICFLKWRGRVVKEKCQVPSDAMALTGGDAESYRNDFQGKWYTTSLRPPSSMLESCDRGAAYRMDLNIVCSELDVSGSHMVLRTVGRRAALTTSRELVFHRGTGGTLYIDRFGTKATKWDPANGEIVIENALGTEVGLRRAAGGASGGGGGVGGVGGDLAAQLTSLAQLHSNGDLSDIEFEAAKAKLVGGGGAMYTPVVAATAVPVTMEMSRAGLIANPGATTGAAFAEQASV